MEIWTSFANTLQNWLRTLEFVLLCAKFNVKVKSIKLASIIVMRESETFEVIWWYTIEEWSAVCVLLINIYQQIRYTSPLLQKMCSRHYLVCKSHITKLTWIRIKLSNTITTLLVLRCWTAWAFCKWHTHKWIWSGSAHVATKREMHSIEVQTWNIGNNRYLSKKIQSVHMYTMNCGLIECNVEYTHCTYLCALYNNRSKWS